MNERSKVDSAEAVNILGMIKWARQLLLYYAGYQNNNEQWDVYGLIEQNQHRTTWHAILLF